MEAQGLERIKFALNQNLKCHSLCLNIFLLPCLYKPWTLKPSANCELLDRP